MKENSEKGQITQQLVTKFFDGYVDDFYSIYENQSNLSKLFNHIFRRSMYRRFFEARNIFLSNEVKSLLDVGCGTGIHEERCNNECSCEFVIADFSSMNFNDKYDGVLSLGVLEYIEDIVPFLKKMTDVSNKVVVASLPVKWNILMPQRKVRYWMRNCPLYFYSETNIKKIIHEAGISNYSILNLGRDYLLVLKV